MTRTTTTNLFFILPILLMLPTQGFSFCGFYVGKAGAELFNEASKVVVTRDGDQTVLTMANDFQGNVKEFAIVFPVPNVLEKDDVRIASPDNIDHIDRYSAPRLVKYIDYDPCAPAPNVDGDFFGGSGDEFEGASLPPKPEVHGVNVEASYQVGEYDIKVLSGKESNGLLTWLAGNGYQVPPGAEAVLGSYLKQKMKFFVAEVNLEAFSQEGYTYLRPLQVRYTSDNFILPIRLGTVNARDDQELIAYFMTPLGTVECTNYRTEKIPSNFKVPTYVKDEFGDFYKSLFQQQTISSPKSIVLEYSWGMGSCDPCAADPLSEAQLLDLGCHWLKAPKKREKWSDHTYLTRLHVRYNSTTFPEDLQFQVTNNQRTFQGRYVMRVPLRVTRNCPAMADYLRDVKDRWETEVANVVKYTGANATEVWKKHPTPYAISEQDKKLYKLIRMAR